MKTEPKAMQEVHEIRIELGEITKNMTPEELVKFYNDSTKSVIQEYGMLVGTPKGETKRAV